MNSTFIKFNQPSKGTPDITSMSVGEEGGDKPKLESKPKPQPSPLPEMTTMALGEEGGDKPKPQPAPTPLPDMTTMAMGEEGGSVGGSTTRSIGEEGGGSYPDVTTMALGEEGGLSNPTPKPVSPGKPSQQNFSSILDLLKQLQSQWNWY